jgi:hypothetical protein
MPKKEKKTLIYDIQEFKHKDIKRHCTWMLIGKRRSGKSRLLFDLLHHTAHHYDIAFGIAETTDSFTRLQKIIPWNQCKRAYTEEFVSNVVNGMRNWHETPNASPKNGVLVLDDCLFNPGILKTDAQRQIFMNSRNFNLTSFTTTQYLVDIPPAIRTNVDYVMAMKEPSLDNRKKLYKYFFGVFPTFKAFDTAFQQITQNYGVMVLDNTSAECSVNSTIKKYRANPDPVPLRLAKDIFFEIADKKRRSLKQKSKHVDTERVIVTP